MKNKILLSLIISLIVGGCTQKKPTEITVLGMWTDYALMPSILNGKVKEVKELNYWAVEKDGKITKGDLMTKKDLDSVGSTNNLKAYFNEDGMMTRYELLDKENILQSRTSTINDGKYARWDYKLSDSAFLYSIPQYDNLGYLIGATGYRQKVDTVVNKQVLTHDGKGHLTMLEYFNYKNERTGYNICSLNKEGDVIDTKYYNKNDSLVLTLINIYDEKEVIVKQEVVREEPKSTSTWDYKDLKVDDHGNWIETYAVIDNGKYKIIAERTYVYY